MSHVLSLIAPEAKALSIDHVDRARRAADKTGAACAAPIWLSPQEACDISFEGAANAVKEAARQELGAEPLDVNVVPAAARRKTLLLADMDSTLIGQECIDELAAELGLRDSVAAITERAMRGEITFEPALRERVALLKGLPVATVEQVLETRVTLTPGAATLLATMRQAGAHTALVSGGFTLFTGVIAEQLRFHEHRANTLLHEDGAFTGEVAEPILGPAAKEEALAALSKSLSLGPQATLAIGDGANDSGMVRRAGLGVAYHGKPALRDVADAIIDHADLSAALFLQGYRRDEFVTVA